MLYSYSAIFCVAWFHFIRDTQRTRGKEQKWLRWNIRATPRESMRVWWTTRHPNGYWKSEMKKGWLELGTRRKFFILYFSLYLLTCLVDEESEQWCLFSSRSWRFVFPGSSKLLWRGNLFLIEIYIYIYCNLFELNHSVRRPSIGMR